EHGDEHDHDHGACDPHVWMEPHNVMFWTMIVRDTLVELDPANAETYTANAAVYLETVDELVHDFIRPMVATLPEENRVLITNHDAFGYFAATNEFELLDTIIPSFSTLAQASAADVAGVIDVIREQNVPAIFAETTVSDDLAQQIADETGVQVAVLYSGSLSEADGPASTYVDYIQYNITTIVEALGGGM
ncbi:MAG: zinc ABC transporter substrate-binding protein, partial [Chloroflexota bacterium]